MDLPYERSRAAVTSDPVVWIGMDVMIVDPRPQQIETVQLLPAPYTNFWDIIRPAESLMKKIVKQTYRVKKPDEATDATEAAGRHVLHAAGPCAAGFVSQNRIAKRAAAQDLCSGL